MRIPALHTCVAVLVDALEAVVVRAQEPHQRASGTAIQGFPLNRLVNDCAFFLVHLDHLLSSLRRSNSMSKSM